MQRPEGLRRVVGESRMVRRRRTHREQEGIGAPFQAIAAEATAGLAASTSGIEFVYDTLEEIRTRTGADDLIAVVDVAPLGRQVFRAGRLPIDSDWARMVVDNGHVGLHGLPGPVDPTVGRTVVKLCEVALRLDVALHDAAHDPLTGLLNRRSFEEQLGAACARSERYRWPFALLLLDVDGFKAVNDRFGHATGDAMLKAIGRALTQRVRGGDAAARIGGDEFAMILANAREVDTEGIATRVAAVVSAAVPSASVTVSVGTALAPLHGTSIESLYHQADTAMYDQKARLP